MTGFSRCRPAAEVAVPVGGWRAPLGLPGRPCLAGAAASQVGNAAARRLSLRAQAQNDVIDIEVPK